MLPSFLRALGVLAHKSSGCKIIGPTSRVEQRDPCCLGWVEFRIDLSATCSEGAGMYHRFFDVLT